NSGEWQKVILTPCPPAENKGYVVSGFDPSKVIAIGLRLTSSGGAAYNGPIEIKYSINDSEVRASAAGENIAGFQGPVWVDQRAVSEYLVKKGIDLCLDRQVAEEISGIAPLLSSYILPGTMTVTAVYDKEGDIISVMKADGTTSLLDASGRVTRVISEEGAVFAENVYSSSGEFERTVLSGARERLTTGMEAIALEVERRTSDALLLLAEEKKIIEEDFMEKVMLARAGFAASREEIEAQRYIEVEHKVLWWTWTQKIERPGVNEAIAQINRQEAVFEAEVRAELEKLGGLYDARTKAVLDEKDRVLREYEEEGENMMNAILCREALPAINREYRDILGRDASEDEVKDIFDRITEFDVPLLRAGLLASEEYYASKRFRDQVISGVTALLSALIPVGGGVSGGGRSSILKGLGISPDENVIDVDAAYVDRIASWLEGVDNHFGKSAFGALREFLAANGKAADLSELCVKAIAADLLMGVIVPAAPNSLAISMHAVSLIAAAYGVVSQSARITRDDAERLKKPFMTLIDGGHYVTVLSVSSGKVVYWDNNHGRSGGEVTVTADDFFRGWQGNVITSDKFEASKILGVTAAKKIKGAFFSLIFAAAYSVSALIASVVTAAITAITTIAAPLISAISAVINAVVGGIAAVVEGLKITASGLLGNMGISLGVPTQMEPFIASFADAAICGSTTGLDISAVSGALTVPELSTFTLGYAADTACGFFTSAAVSSTVASAGGFNAASLAGPLIASISSGFIAKSVLAMETLPAVGNAVKLKVTPSDLIKSSPRDLAAQFASFGVELVEADVYKDDGIFTIQGKSLGFIEPVTTVKFDEASGSVKIDMSLDYFNIIERPLRTTVDMATFGMEANRCWEIATRDAARCYDIAVNSPRVKSISIAGINDDGAALDMLARQLSAESNCPVTLAHSAGCDVLPKITNVPADMKFILISPQVGRAELEGWMLKNSISRDRVLIVDVAGDLPYRPKDFVGLTLKDKINPANMNSVGGNAYKVVQRLGDNAYRDYSSNPNKTYVYMRIEEGFLNDEKSAARRHLVGVNGALDAERKFKIEIAGKIMENVSLKYIYKEFQKGRLK
ncbi:MAG: cysteine peptidase family C39 domain-containing protein, partial [Candidatus Omnitrophica bacterium]|nr:cysteine peptidase family C39 domain-containing protein [Candidatus Omnitrophota bacterium]